MMTNHSLYNILKAQKTGIAPDLYTKLRAGKRIVMPKEMEGVPPLTFTTSGSNLSEYQINGNNGASTPDNPIEVLGVGDRTANLFNENTIEVGGLDKLGGGEIGGSTKRRSGFIEVTASTNYSISRIIDASARSELWILGYDSNKQAIRDGKVGGYPPVVASLAEYAASTTFTTTATTKYIRWYITQAGSYGDIMLNLGSTALSYEPYGYKISITLNSVTQNVCLDEPLYSGDYIKRNADGTGLLHKSGVDTSITLPEIQTVAGKNTISIDTTVQPQKIYIKWE